MAVDEAISIAFREGRVPPTLRFYTWAPSCISMGYFQRIEDALYKSSTENMQIVRRITGGRAVIHGCDLSYSVVSRIDNKIFHGNIKVTYLAISEALISGLKKLGIAVSLLKHNKTQANLKYYRSTFCFDTAMGHEVSFEGRKLIGSAQRRWSDTFLQHGSILITGFQRGNGFTSISLSEILGDNIDLKVIQAAFSAGFQEILKTNLISRELTGYEIEIAERLKEEKYSKVSWNIKYP